MLQVRCQATAIEELLPVQVAVLLLSQLLIEHANGLHGPVGIEAYVQHSQG
jgi:hypothetical protein